MKKLLVVAMVLVAGLFFTAGSYALSDQGAAQQGQAKQVDVAAFKNFLKETLPLRDELAVKRLEIRNENAKETPDLNKIATLQKEMIDLRTKIQISAQKNGVPAWGQGRWFAEGRGRHIMAGRGHRMMGGGGFGPGAGGAGGHGPGDCPMAK